MKKADIIARYGEEEYQRRLESNRQWREDNPEYHKQYHQDNKEKIAEQKKQWRKNNPEYHKQWRKNNPEYPKQYYQTQYGRAVYLCSAYQREDKKYNRGECTLTPDYIVEHIFPNGCLYCGEKDYTKLGCDRVDNDLPHTPDNVVCCCTDCNKKRRLQGFDKFLNMSWRKRFS